MKNNNEIAQNIEYLIDEIYEKLDEIKEELRQVTGDNGLILDRARAYWLAHIDCALQNRGSWLDSSTRAQDTINEIYDLEEN